LSRRHYVYFRVAAADVEAAVTAIVSMQAALRARHAALRAELLRRPAADDGLVTLMEVYGFAAGHDTAAIAAEAAAASARWCRGTRHVEAFDTLG